MATTQLKGTDVNTVGDLPLVGTEAPVFTFTGTDLAEVSSSSLGERQLVLNIFPSVDTGVCATSVRRFNELAAGLDNTTVLCLSNDLPMALARFCGAEGIDNVVVGSGFRTDLGHVFGLTMVDGPLAGLLARSVIVINAAGEIVLTELVPEITTEPNYEAALQALQG